ncbi:MAG: chorismate synthase [Phycisphaerae bacterium]|nr:chorismate synthase [Phycisphaerae bacterium]
MKIVITGPKGSGKSALGRELVNLTHLPIIETDALIETLHQERDGHFLTCREIFVEHGEDYFRNLEREVTQQVSHLDWHFIVTGGSIMVDPDNRRALRTQGLIILVSAQAEVLWHRATANGVPPWLKGPQGRSHYEQQVALRDEVIRPFADILVDTSEKSPEVLADEVMQQITNELSIRSHAANTYGDVIHLTTFGESHGPAIGAILDGVQPGLDINEADIQLELNRRRPGQSDVVTPRSEKDRVHILSGVFEGKTTGAPIAMVIYNQDQDSSKYEGIKELFRPGHADFTFYKKYGIRDHRGGGRSSGRETAGRVMGGAIARKILAARGVTFVAHAVEVAGIKAETCDHAVIEANVVRCADPVAAKAMEAAILAARDDSDSVGGVIQLEIYGVPAGLGDPVFDKLDARLAKALLSLGATKGFEIGKGFALTRLRGSQSNDGMSSQGFISNNAGGITGGISTGEPIIVRMAVKPTSSIVTQQKTIDIDLKDQTIEVHGRHDPCIVPRIIPVVENMAALVILDAWEIQERLRPDWRQ